MFFSLSLVLFGAINLLLVWGDRSNRYSILVVLLATSILWLARCGLQLVYPQGTLYPGLQYGMLSAFAIIFLCYATPFLLLWFQRSPAGG